MRALSGGMKRRVLVGQALVHKPPVIVLDEPTAGVDVELRQSLWAFIRKLNRDGHTIILTTHYLEEAEALCGRIAMLKAGRIVALDTTQNLLSTLRRTHRAADRRRAAARRVAEPRVLRRDGADVSADRLGRLRRAREHCSRRCAKRGIAIIELSLQEADLEQVFLRIMARRSEGDRPADARRSRRGAPSAGTRRGLADAALQGAAAFLEGELPDDPRAGADGAALPADLFARARVARLGLRRAALRYTAFLIPGLVMMSVLQNAFANSSSSLIQSKITGNLIFILLPPLSPLDIFAAYVLGAMVRGLVVGLGVFVVTLCVRADRAWRIRSGRSPSRCSAARSWARSDLIAGIWADKFDQLAAFQNFLIMPLTFLSGVFYSIHSLPPFWQALSHFNPFFYMIDGFRYGFFGLSDVRAGDEPRDRRRLSARHCAR